MRLLQLLIGLVFALPGALALAPMIAAFRPGPAAAAQGATGPFATFWLTVLVGTLVIGFAATLRGTVGRGLALLGVAVLSLPLSLLLATGRVAIDSGGLLPGLATGVAGGLVALLAGVPGVIAGAVLLVMGLAVLAAGR